MDIRAPIENNNCGVGNIRVTAVTVGDEFHEKWALAGGHPLFRKLDTLVDGDDIHGIDLTKLVRSNTSQNIGDHSYLDTGDGITAGIVGSVGRRSLSGSAHTIFVVLANEDARQVPEFGHVERFEDLTLVASAITVESEGGNVIFSGVLLSESKTSSKRNLGTDDAVSSEEGRGEDVHGSTLSIGHAVLATKELGQDTLDGSSP